MRNRAKIESAIKNAKAFLEVQEELGSFDATPTEALAPDDRARAASPRSLLALPGVEEGGRRTTSSTRRSCFAEGCISDATVYSAREAGAAFHRAAMRRPHRQARTWMNWSSGHPSTKDRTLQASTRAARGS